jgi:hypothetical protein
MPPFMEALGWAALALALGCIGWLWINVGRLR